MSAAYPGGGKRLTGACRGGVPEGRWTWWHPNGTAELEAAFADGKPDGVWRQRTDSGRQLGEYRFAAGSGRAVLWAADGSRRAASDFRGGVQHGEYSAWSAEGRRAIQGRVIDGKPDGVWTTWDETGRLVRRELRDPRCLIVAAALEGSPAARAGIRPGDRFEGVNGARVESGDALRGALAAAGERPVEVRIRRAGRERSMRVTPAIDQAGDARIGTRLTCCHVLVPDGQECEGGH